MIHKDGSVSYQTEDLHEQSLLPKGSVRYDGNRFSLEEASTKPSAFPVPPLTAAPPQSSSRRFIAKDLHLPSGIHTFGKQTGQSDYGWRNPIVEASRIEETLGPLGGNMESTNKGMVIFKDGDGRLCLFATGVAYAGRDGANRPCYDSLSLVGEADGKMTLEQKFILLVYIGAIHPPGKGESLKLKQFFESGESYQEFAKAFETFKKDENQLLAEEVPKLQAKIEKQEYKTLFNRSDSLMVNRDAENIVTLYTLLTSEAMKNLQNGEVVAAFTHQSLDYIKQNSRVNTGLPQNAIYPDARWVIASQAPEKKLI